MNSIDSEYFNCYMQILTNVIFILPYSMRHFKQNNDSLKLIS